MVSSKDGIASVEGGAIARTRTIGRDEFGRNITETLPSCKGQKYLDPDGNEVHVPLYNHRVPTSESFEKYGRPRHLELVRDGWLPKSECPLTTAYSGYVGGGSLVSPLDGEEICGKDQIGPHGCAHYVRARDARREDAALRAKQRRDSANRKDHAVAEKILEWATTAREVAAGPSTMPSPKPRSRKSGQD